MRFTGRDIGSRARGFWACEKCGWPHSGTMDTKCRACGGKIVHWDSQGEFQRWRELQLLERAGEITRLRRQDRIPLVGEGGRPILNENGRHMKYVADFGYYDTKEACGVIEDYKPRRKGKLILTPEAALKLAILNAMFSGTGRKLIVAGKEWGNG